MLSRVLLSAAAVVVAAAAAGAQVSFVAARAAITGAAQTQFGNIPFGPASNPVTVSTTLPGLTVTASNPGGSLYRYTQSGGWSGNFAPGAPVLFMGSNGSISLAFSSLVGAVGTQIQRNFYGAFTGTISAFDASDALLGSFSVAGTSNGNADDSAVFLGIASAQTNIARVAFSVDNGADFGMNDLSIGDAAVTATPEPGTYVLLATGLAMIAGVARRRRTA